MGPPSEQHGATCSICRKSLPATRSWDYVHEQRLGGRIVYNFTPPGGEIYYRRDGEEHRCRRCYKDPNWKSREQEQRRREERRREEEAERKRREEETQRRRQQSKEAAQKTAESVDRFREKQHEERVQEKVYAKETKQQQIISPPDLKPVVPDPQELSDPLSSGKIKEILSESDVLNESSVLILLEGLSYNPEIFELLNLEQTSSFRYVLSKLLVNWKSDPTKAPSLEVFRWIHVYLVEGYLTMTNHHKDETVGDHVFDLLKDVFRSVNPDEMSEMTCTLFLALSQKASVKVDDNLSVGDMVTVEIIHSLLSHLFAGNEHITPPTWTKFACTTLISILVQPPSTGKFDYRSALSKLVHGNIWKPIDIVSLVLSFNQLVDVNDKNGEKAFQKIIAFNIDFMLLPSVGITVLDMLQLKGSTGLLEAVENFISKDEEKNLESLCAEILQNNWASAETVKRAQDIVSSTLAKLRGFGYPNELTETQDQLHDSFKSLGNFESGKLPNLLALLCCVVKQDEKFRYWPRASQLLSCAVLLTSEEAKGRLIEIATGEGKSCIIAMFASVLALSGTTVDIVTSAPALAERDADDWSQFYRFLGLDANCNVNPGNDDERKACYQGNIVYGTVGSFASDILRHEFHMQEVRGSRRTENSAVIVDEVDFMLLDRGVQYTYLSHKSLGFRHLHPIFALIWNAVNRFTPIMIENAICFHDKPQPFYKAIQSALESDSTTEASADEKLFELLAKAGLHEFSEPLKNEGTVESNILSTMNTDKMSKLFKKANDELNENFEVFTLNNGTVENLIPANSSTLDGDIPKSVLLLDEGICIVLVKEQETLVSGISAYILEELETTDPEGIKVPKHLEEFVENRLEVWVRSAFQALRMSEGREYILKNSEVLPVDFRSTGTVEMNKKWSNGLQQFVELKHNLQMSEISLVTNFMSNLTYFMRYGSKVYGVTGTLGSETDRDFLKKQFNVDFCQMPTHKTRKLYEDQGQTFPNGSAWLHGIVKEFNCEIDTNRAALVICEDIKTANKISEELKGKVPGKVHSYTGGGRNANKLPSEKLDAGDVIVATNLAGRGTDIKVTERVNAAGGLFVLVTYLPSNTRVEKQAFGRTGRKGLPGSAKIILNSERLPAIYKENATNVEGFKVIRNDIEKERVRIMVDTEVRECSVKDNLFKQYCCHVKSAIKEFKTFKDEDDKNLAITFLHEKWGLWLQMMSEEIRASKTITALNDPLDKMASDAIEQITSKQSFNIYHIIRFGNEHMFNREFPKATGFYERAKNADDTWSCIALYNKAYSELKQGKPGYMESAKDELQESLKRLENYKIELQHIESNILSSQRDGTENVKETDVLKNNDMRRQIIDAFERNIREAISKLTSIIEKDAKAEAEAVPVTTLAQSYDDGQNNELSELVYLGLRDVFSVKEKPRFCWSALAVFFIGIAQVAAGIFLSAISFGTLATVGKALIEEGTSDIIKGVKGMKEGEFDWKSWGIGKAVSLAIGILTAGIGQLISKAKKVFKKALGIVSESADTLKRATAEVGKNGLKSSIKTSCKAVGKELVETGFDWGVDEVIDAIMKEQEEKLMKSIENDIKEAAVSGELSTAIDRMATICTAGNDEAFDEPEVCRAIEKNMMDFSQLVAYDLVNKPKWRQYIEQRLNDLVNELKSQKKLPKYFSVSFKAASLTAGAIEAGVKMKDLSDSFRHEIVFQMEEWIENGDHSPKQTEEESMDIKVITAPIELKQSIGHKLAKDLSSAIIAIWNNHFVGQAKSVVNSTIKGTMATACNYRQDKLRELHASANPDKTFRRQQKFKDKEDRILRQQKFKGDPYKILRRKKAFKDD